MKWDIENHLRQFPHSAIMEKEGRVYGVFVIGNTYRSISSYYGSYPNKYLERIYSLISASPVLHLFSGSLTELQVPATHWRVDINPEFGPDVCCKAEDVAEHFEPNFFPLIIADPPYSQDHSKRYGYGMPNVAKVMQALYKITKPGGMVVWLSTHPPMRRSNQWTWKGSILLRVGTNKTVRNIEFLEKIVA